MAEPAIDNRSPFAFFPFFTTDEEGRPILVPTIKATYRVVDDRALRLAEEQAPLCLAGEYFGEPGKSSPRLEPEGTHPKSGTDFVLIGHAHAPRRGVRVLEVRLRAGDLSKVVRVSGDRRWVRRLFWTTSTAPAPFERIPLVYERAFGGWDRSHPDERKHRFDPRNPVGTGFRARGGRFEPGLMLPNLEDPRRPQRKYRGSAAVAGFGFLSPHWQPRAGFAGTYDATWEKERRPLLPRDFDPRFHRAAHPDLTAADHFRGDESVLVTNVTRSGKLAFELPGIPPPECEVVCDRGEDQRVVTALDTVILDADAGLLFLIWRGRTALREGPYDVTDLLVEVAGLPTPAAAVA